MLLILVLVIVAMLGLAGMAFVDWMLTEHQAARLGHDQSQAVAAVESGLEYLRAALEQPARGPTAVDVYDNPERFCGVPLEYGAAIDEAASFTILSPRPEVGASGVRFGLVNESSRLHLGAVLAWELAAPGAGRKSLLALPGMSPELADALLDWLDADDQPREQGAERDYYSALDPPLAPANRLPNSLDELLAVRGMTRESLFGLDANQNGLVEPHEAASAADASLAPNSGGAPAELPTGGWSSLWTLVAAEANVDARGRPRVDLNDADLAQLYERLGESLDAAAARFVVAYRQFGPAPAFLATRAAPQAKPDLLSPPRYKLRTLFDLIDAKVLVRGATSNEQFVLESPWQSNDARFAEQVDRLFDATTTSAAPFIAGRVNVNLAPIEVLAAVPGVDRTLADELVSKRPAAARPADAARRSLAWIVSERAMPLAKARILGEFLTTGGDVYRAQIVGFSGPRQPRARYEAVVLAFPRHSRVLLWKDLAPAGPGYPYELLRALAANAPGG